ncbi:MAG: DUF3489 domain-containing protein [Rhodospirillales bacterium]|nr:DUF3489 domain-containing protein [Rhodospirillales bacterium]
MPAKPTKTATILRLLRHPGGAGMAERNRAIGWQDHGIRAALTGLRKMGHVENRKKTDAGVSRCHVGAEDRS